MGDNNSEKKGLFDRIMNSNVWQTKWGMLMILVICLAVIGLILFIPEYFLATMWSWYDEGTILTNLLSLSVPLSAWFYYLGYRGKTLLYCFGFEAFLILIAVLYFNDSKIIPFLIVAAVVLGVIAAYISGLSIMKKDKNKHEQKGKAELESKERIKIMRSYGKYTEKTVRSDEL